MKNTLLFEIEMGDNPIAHLNYLMSLKIGLFAIKDANIHLLFKLEINERKEAFLANYKVSEDEFEKLEQFYLIEASSLIIQGINSIINPKIKSTVKCCFCNCDTVEDINALIPSCELHKDLSHEKFAAFTKKYTDYTKWSELKDNNPFELPFPENLKRAKT